MEVVWGFPVYLQGRVSSRSFLRLSVKGLLNSRVDLWNGVDKTDLKGHQRLPKNTTNKKKTRRHKEENLSGQNRTQIEDFDVKVLKINHQILQDLRLKGCEGELKVSAEIRRSPPEMVRSLEFVG